jgi:methionine-S-sulfoxide reductase
MLLVLFGMQCGSIDGAEQKSDEMGTTSESRAISPDEVPEGKKVAMFAGGCFWCVEASFQKLDGVESAVSGFAGGEKADPKYKAVAYGRTGYTETVRIVYDPEEISYEKLLQKYWQTVNPTQENGQFVDTGSQYRPVIFYLNDEQKQKAEASKEKLAENGPFDKPIVVPIKPATEFWPASAHHQDYFKTQPDHYESYYRGSGRPEFYRKHWGG